MCCTVSPSGPVPTPAIWGSCNKQSHPCEQGPCYTLTDTSLHTPALLYCPQHTHRCMTHPKHLNRSSLHPQQPQQPCKQDGAPSATPTRSAVPAACATAVPCVQC
jgi:hypothetical protein